MTKEELVNYWKSSGLIKDENVIKVFLNINRENFIPAKYKPHAYEDIPLPIFKDITISQPSTIVIMLQALEIQKGNKILEIGTGSGYTGSLMSRLVGPNGKIISMEIQPKIAKLAEENIKKENIRNMKIINKDGSNGLKSEAPFDRIILHAASDEIPKKLISQLKNNGILVAPVGPSPIQKMIKLIKTNNELKKTNLGDFIFVRLRK